MLPSVMGRIGSSSLSSPQTTFSDTCVCPSENEYTTGNIRWYDLRLKGAENASIHIEVSPAEIAHGGSAGGALAINAFRFGDWKNRTPHHRSSGATRYQ
jgi:hypothetical protein